MLVKSFLLLFFVVPLSSQIGERYFRQSPSGGARDWNRKYSQALSSDCHPPRLEHGRIKLRLRGRIAKFTCQPRFELVGNSYAFCADGKWDVAFPVCVKPGCPVVNSLERGLVMKTSKDAWLNFFCLPGHKLVGSPAMYCNGRDWNTTMPVCVDETGPPKLSCDFETPDICSWQQDELHDFDWRRLNKGTPSSFLKTGPSFDHTLGIGKHGYYMYIESTARKMFDTARLISPIYDSTLAKDGCFSFFYHMFGLSVGGLRVYQKPDKLTLPNLLELSTEEKKKYILFEKWKNQDDVWYQSVSYLTDFNDDFQIIIEGIRGRSFTSDIAIDDVAILQGNNCTQAMHAASTPPAFMYYSCNNRCNQPAEIQENYCICTEDCTIRGTCCADYFDVCVYNDDSDQEYVTMNYTSETMPIDDVPQTQKLVGTVDAETVPTTTLTTVTSTKASTASTSRKPLSTTTASITTKKVTSIPTTTKKLPKLVFKTTTQIFNATGILRKDNKTEVVIKTMNATSPKPITVKATTVKPTTFKSKTVKPTTKKSTTFSHGVSRTFENHNQYHDLVEEAKNRQKAEINGQIVIGTGKNKDSTPRSKTTLIVLAVLVCCAGVACAVWGGRTARGRAAMARLRGRVTHDSEVRFLTQSEEE